METNPITEVSDDSAIEIALADQFAGKFGEDERKTEPENVEAEEVQEDESTAETEPEEETADLDIDGYTLKLPKSKAEKLNAERLMQADYTRKTQDLARQREAVELQQKSVQLSAQAQQALSEKAVNVRALDAQLKAFEGVNWTEQAQTDSAQAMALLARRDELRQLRERELGEYQQLQAHFTREQQATDEQWKQKLQSLGQERLTKELNGWDEKKASDTAQFLLQEAGYQPAELQGMLSYDPRFIRLAYEAKMYRALQKTKVETIEKKVATAKPFVPAASRGTVKAQATGEAQQLRDKMRKTGSRDDVEAFLARRFAGKSR